MKYFAAFCFLICIGCSTATGPYSPGGEHYVAPGTFVGTWVESRNLDSATWTADTSACEAIIMQADSLVIGTITNIETKETIALRGRIYLGPTQNYPDLKSTSYLVGDSMVNPLDFSENGSHLDYMIDQSHGSSLHFVIISGSRR